MAMTLAMDREPEVARFIDTYKFDQDMATKRDRFGGGTSLPLNSDGYEDKQRALRDERHKDWLVQQDKPKEPVYYRVGTPEQGFPGLGEYERQRQDKNIARQKEYNEMLKKQRHAEQQKQEARRYAPQARPAQPLGPQMDYNAAGELAKAEEKKAYQDYMGNWRTDQINAPHKPYMDYWENQRFLKEERRREYNELLEKKAKEERYWALRGRPVTPPGGLNIGQYDRQVKEQAPQKKQEYKRMLDEQKYTQLKLRAMDHAADLSSKYVRYREEERPLVGSPRDINPYMQEKESKDKFRRDLKNIPVQNHSPSSQNVNETSRDDPNYKAFMEVEKDKARDKRKYAEELLKQQKEHMFLRARQEPEMAVIDRNAQSSQFLANKPPPGPSYGRGRDEDEKRKHESEVFQQQHGGKPAEIVKNPFYSSDDYEKFQKELKKKQEKEYSEFLSKQYQPNKDAQGLPLGQYKYEPMRLHLEAERNKEYNELLEKQNSPRVPKQVDGPQGLNIDVSYHREKQEWLEKQRNKDYNEYLKKEEEQRRFSRDGNSAPKTTCGSTFQPPSSPFRNVRQTPSPVRVRQQHRSDQMSHVLSREDTPNQRREPNIQGRLSNHEQLPNHTQTKGFEEHNGHPPYGSDHEYHNQEPMHHQMAAPYPKASSVPLRSPPATPSKLSLPVGQYDEMRPFLVKQRNKEYNSVKEKLPPLKKTGITPRATKVSLPVGQYDEERPFFEKQRNAEYNELLEKGKLGKHTFRTKVATPPSLQGLPIGQQHYDPMYRAMEHQRNREYNDFLQKKYGGNKTFRSSRSQPEKPTQPKSSFYYGNELEHEEKRKMLDDERRNDYHQFMKEVNNTDVKPGNYNPQIQEPPRSKSIDIPTDADSGLPIGQHHHEAWRKFLREQRNSEYNQLRETKQSEKRNRNWNFDETGVLELKGDDEVQLKKRELRAERREDYNQYISQIKAPTRRNWPEPEGQDGLLVRNGEYDNVRQMYDEERKRDYNDTMRKRREMGLDLTPPSAPAEPLQSRYEYFNPMINVLGRYEDYRKKLKDDRRKDFRHHMDQVKAEDTHRRTYVNTAPTIAREETPIVNSLGLYETETKNKMRAQRKKDMEEQVHEQEKHWTPRVTVKENLMPHVADSETPLVNYMGQYDKDRLKFRLERNKELRDFSEKKKHELRNPYDHFVYPTVAVAEKPIVEYMGGEVERRKHDLREERKKEYELFKKQVASNNQKVAHPGRRHEFVDSANGPYGGLFHGLGEHGNRSDDLNRERHREYNEKLEQQYAGRDRPGGRPKWVQESLPNNTDRGRSPMKTQPPTDQYQQMLNEKRREEANMRRYEDPEYQDRLAHGRDRGEAGQRYGY
ncbi:trichohyalin-like isoform X32 [Ruditapes philippinarum]|uniref:trichohyalin-like isoform X32 n=1 Tax=Ruditapes philippinarum TaxID=129788 RepID=UPI00295B306C|nr:trichohyalin-like isoform X32 [Ruditapes philippinarum]